METCGGNLLTSARKPTCPKCGAKCDVNNEKEKAVCPDCGWTGLICSLKDGHYLVKKSNNYGYPFESYIGYDTAFGAPSITGEKPSEEVVCPYCNVSCEVLKNGASKCPKCGRINLMEYDPFGGLPFAAMAEPTAKRLVINKSWVLEEGVAQPAYDPSIWGERHPDFARKKMEQIEDDIDEGLLYPSILETIEQTLKPGESVLDVGCAGGHFYREMLKWIGQGIDYTGVDITEKYIEFARERFPDKKWLVADARKLPFPDQSFDHSLCLFVLVHLNKEGMHQALNELARVTRKQMLFVGYFSVTRICGHQLSGESQHKSDFIYDIIDLKEMMLPGWDLELMKEEPKLLHLPVSIEDADGKWIDTEADVPVVSYVRLVRR